MSEPAPSVHVFTGLTFVYDTVPELPLRMPAGVLAARIRARPGEFALVFLRYADRTERRLLAHAGDHLYPHLMMGENRRFDYGLPTSFPPDA